MTAVVMRAHNTGGQAEEPERQDCRCDQGFHGLLHYVVYLDASA
jgi:hypothetical protein